METTLIKVEAFCTIPEGERKRRPGEETYHEWWSRAGRYLRKYTHSSRSRIYGKRGHASQFIAAVEAQPHWDYKLYEMTGKWVECPPK